MHPRPKQALKTHVSPEMAAPMLMMGAAVCFALMSTIIKLMPQEYSAWHLGFIRFMGGLVILVSFSLSRKQNPFKGHNIPLLIIRGFTGTVAFISAVTAIRALPLSTACVLFYTYPVFAAIFGVWLYKEKIFPGQMICIFAMISGVIVLYKFGLEGFGYGLIASVIAAVFAGLTTTLIRELKAQNGVAVIYLYFCATGAAVTSIPSLMAPVVPGTVIEWGMLAGIALFSLAAQLMMNYGFHFCTGFEGGVYMSTETVFTAVIGISFLNDPVSWNFWAGGALILGSGLALNRISHTRVKTVRTKKEKIN